MLSLHPMFAPRTYVDVAFDLEDDAVRIGIRDCPALGEGDAFSWLAGLGAGMDGAIDAIVRSFDPQARCEPVVTAGGEVHAYRATIDRSRPPAREPEELGIARISTGAAFRFRVPTAVW
jgi:hypothetical protein